MVVTDRDGNVHEVEGRIGVKLMETLREGITGPKGITEYALIRPHLLLKRPEMV